MGKNQAYMQDMAVSQVWQIQVAGRMCSIRRDKEMLGSMTQEVPKFIIAQKLITVFFPLYPYLLPKKIAHTTFV